MTREKMLPILQKIQEYDHIILFRHKRPDGDCLGASKGLQRMLRLSFPEKQIDLPESDVSGHLAFLGPDDPAMSEAAYVNALGMVVDTGSSDRISNPHFSLCRELVKIDHHPPGRNGKTPALLHKLVHCPEIPLRHPAVGVI